MPVQRHVTGSAARCVRRDHNGELPRPPRQRQSASEASPITSGELDLAGNRLIQGPVNHLPSEPTHMGFIGSGMARPAAGPGGNSTKGAGMLGMGLALLLGSPPGLIG